MKTSRFYHFVLYPDSYRVCDWLGCLSSVADSVSISPLSPDGEHLHALLVFRSPITHDYARWLVSDALCTDGFSSFAVRSPSFVSRFYRMNEVVRHGAQL